MQLSQYNREDDFQPQMPMRPPFCYNTLEACHAWKVLLRYAFYSSLDGEYQIQKISHKACSFLKDKMLL